MADGSSNSLPDDKLLGRIAAALNIPVDALFLVPEQFVFHTDVGGTRWLLTNGSPGSPTVRRVSAQPSEPNPSEESVTAFLSRNVDTPQGKALATMIDRMLSMHLHLDMRS
jgi:hypothetical protein